MTATTERQERTGRHARDGAGVSERSHVKHDLFSRMAKRSAYAQDAIGRKRGRSRGVIIDMHAGDGFGVEDGQLDMFGVSMSCPTAQLACTLGKNVGADVILCETVPVKRAALRRLAEAHLRVMLLTSHERLLERIGRGDYDWMLVLNDPCGPTRQGVPVLARLVERVPCSDVVMAVNEKFILRYRLMKAEGPPGEAEERPMVAAARSGREKFLWMIDPAAWVPILRKRYLHRTRHVQDISNNFGARIMLWSNYHFNRAFERPPFQTIDLGRDRP